MIGGLIVSYGVLCLLLLGLRMVFAQAHRLRRRRVPWREYPNGVTEATISVIYPVYNESPGVLRRVMEGAKSCLSLAQIEIIVVDDGSPNRSELKSIYQEYEHPQLRILYQDNQGKRRAQHAGLSVATGEFIVTVDSDTLIDPENLRRLIAPLTQDERIGAVCGEVFVTNSSVNLLTRLIGRRYWTAFNLERAAQSFFRSVLCCSGPFSAYRSSVLHKVKDAYIRQTFRGQLCTYGDDRHLTNLVLSESFHVIYEPGAVASTFAPETLGDYIKQQNRWNKSFYREMLWTLRIADCVHLYSLLDMLVQPLLFVGFTSALAYALLLLLRTGDLTIVGFYLATLVIMASVRALYGLLCTRELGFLLFILYGFLHVFVLIPVRFKSILTLTDNRWGTRDVKRASPYRDFASWAASYCGVLLVGAGLMAFLGQHELADVAATGQSQLSATVENRLLHVATTAVCWLGVLGLLLGGFVGVARKCSKRGRKRMPPVVVPPIAAETVGDPITR